MASNDLFSKIHANYNIFTRAEKKVADFILINSQDVLYMSITDLADACNVGDTSVFRFCRTLQFHGYQEFKMTLAQNVNSEEDGVPQLSGEINMTDSTEEMAKKVLLTNVTALNETYDMLKKNDISLAVNYMLNAKKIVFFGVGASLITAMEARNKFMRIIPNVECIFDTHLQTMTAALMTEDDLAVTISYSGSTKDTVDIAKLCRSIGVKVISITRFGKSPLTSYSDLTLLSGANEGPLQGGSLSAKISQLYLLDVLYVEYFRKTFENSKINKKKTSSSVINKLY